jgi:Prokaryotic N-terminal methylation motif
MKARAGITLVEVLVAIFIMSIGLLALLTLFPLGALSMAAALKDQRNSEASKQADALANSWSVRTDPTVTPFFNGPGNTLASGYDGASFPVFVDPWGISLGAGATLGPVARTNTSYANTLTTTMLNFGLQDEMTFLNNGIPDTSGGLQRSPNTTWAYWLRRPNNMIPNVVELSIVVYSNRNLQTGSGEIATNNILFNAGTPSAVAVPVGTDVRRNMWILDVTPSGAFNVPAGNWYRVVGADDTGVGVQLELQPVPVVAMQNIIVMEDVAEVFPRGTGWK